MITRLACIRAAGLCAAIALSTGLPPLIAHAQNADDTPGGTLGIDCEQPRRTPEGKLILGDDGNHRARCEADRATALNYALVVRETRNRIRSALSLAPQPLWDDLVTHLNNDGSGPDNDQVSNWTYSNSDIDDLPDGTKAWRAAEYWKEGVLNRSAVPDDWRPLVKARACGVDITNGRLELENGASVLAWLEPQHLRDRWSPQMVQRTVRAWLERQDGRFSMSEHIPDVLIRPENADPYLINGNGKTRDIPTGNVLRDCLDLADAEIPAGALVMRSPLRWASKRGESVRTCDDPDKVGIQRLGWERHNGLYVVPTRAILPDGAAFSGTAHPQRGKPLLEQFTEQQERPVLADEAVSINYPIVEGEEDSENDNQKEATFLLQDACRAPRVKDIIRTEACTSSIAGNSVEGEIIRTFRLREFQDDPNDPHRVHLKPVQRDPNDEDNGFGVPVTGDAHPLWSQQTIGCPNVPDPELPVIPPPVVDTVPATTCQQQWGSQFPQGQRHGFVQTITYPESWGQDDVVVRTVDDDCYQPLPRQGTQNRPGTCRPGNTGKITESRTLRWWDIDWAVNPRHGDMWVRSLTEAGSAYDASRPLLNAPVANPFNRVTLPDGRNWHVTYNACARRWTTSESRSVSCGSGYTGSRQQTRDTYHTEYEDPARQDTHRPGSWRTTSSSCQKRSSGGNSGGGGEGVYSIDTDGDGRTDREANKGDIGARNVGVGTGGGRRGASGKNN